MDESINNNYETSSCHVLEIYTWWNITHPITFFSLNISESFLYNTSYTSGYYLNLIKLLQKFLLFTFLPETSRSREKPWVEETFICLFLLKINHLKILSIHVSILIRKNTNMKYFLNSYRINNVVNFIVPLQCSGSILVLWVWFEGRT